MKPTQLLEISAFEGRIPSELSADYILPDIYPDVKRILRVAAKPILISRYIAGRRLEFSGAVDYVVIFSADTENGESMHSVHFSGDWDGSVGDLETLERANIAITPSISACSARMANPRKLTLKSTVATSVKITLPCPVEPTLDGAPDLAVAASLEKLTSTVTARRERTFLSDPLRISENLEPDATQPAIDEIISCSAELFFNDAKVNLDDSTVSLKGLANVSCIYKSQGEAGTYKSFSRKIPVTYVADAADHCGAFSACRPESLCARANATTVEINADVGENPYGERRVVELDVSADVSVYIVGGEDVSVVLDAYSTTHTSECTVKEHVAKTPDKMLTTSFSVGELLSRDVLSIGEGASIIDTQIDIVSPEVISQRGRLALTASALVAMIVEDGGSYSGVTATLPIKCDLGAPDMSDKVICNAKLCAADIRTRTSGEGVHLDFEVSVCAALCEAKSVSALSAIRITGELERECGGAVLTLCYPSADDTLWQVAKRYKTTVAAIEAANAADSSVLVIPRTGV